MLLDAYASRSHFFDHLAPLYAALADDIRGTFFAPRDVVAWAARPSAPVKVPVVEGMPTRYKGGPVLVASFADHHDVGRRSILLNHGAGQSYQGGAGPECYSGGPGRDRVLLAIEPGSLAARASERAGHRYEAVGCPRMDGLHRGAFGGSVSAVGAVVAVAIRQHEPPQSQACPEQRSAWPHYEAAMAALARRFDLVGHAHPRGWARASRRWEAMGVPLEVDSYRVLERASVLVTDTSSIGWEFASLGKPVVWCNSPWYRRHVDHGGRFWGPLPGYVVDEPEQLGDAIEAALTEPYDPAWRDAVADVYTACDGGASARAAGAIVSVLGEM